MKTAGQPCDPTSNAAEVQAVADTKDNHLVRVLSDSKLLHLARIRRRYKPKWRWGAGAEYLFRELIHAYGLQEYETLLVRLAKPKPGRRQETELAERIWQLKAEGKTVPEILATFRREGQHYSKEKVESYLKTRRKEPSKKNTPQHVENR